ncbi:uncharacterized protein B0J16DRAFT_318788 [Fusarium flagelliforme]|uniref:Uncharacterized protein n=1 Tax=Fusarium flagelliforme TaxID=2675880 RepID=A0A395N3X4_9HYPO|nr:uncharacterized protein B0J16DRAFT_318788 [Fusarium flagelliforme]KAH7189150.1 hypothetical protein B0J16DRAFT_318788 [Fusarium flagelliforme]RFN54630.1 hypothetical protein FIE12Z_1110 [Fusarium flagelliforme]
MGQGRRLASFTDLSPELLRQIFGHFCLHCCDKTKDYLLQDSGSLAENYCRDRQVLVALCLASRHFRDVSQEILHHVFLIAPSEPDLVRQPSVKISLARFIRTIASKRHLAAATKAVVFFHSLEAPNVQLEDAQECFRHVAEVTGTQSSEVWDQRKNLAPYRDDFLQELILGKAHARCDPETIESHANTLATELLFILVALLPKLPHLALDVSIHQTFDQLEALKALGVSRLPLKTLEIDGVSDSAWLSSQLITRSPDLETLCLYHSTSLPEISTIKMLHLRRFRMSVKQLESILSSCTGQLRTFTYEASDIVAYHVDENTSFMIQARDAIQVLEKHNKSLEKLHLDLRIRTFMCRNTKIAPMSSLETFTTLQELLINTDAVYNDQSSQLQLADEILLTRFLPPNIVSLHLVEPEFPTLPARIQRGLIGLADLKSRDSSRFPNLKQVTCDNKEMFKEYYVRNVLSEVGIDLIHKEFPRPDWSYDRGHLISQHPQKYPAMEERFVEEEFGILRCYAPQMPDESDDDL